jgi:LDH2 family malate/lactate/ureidoglycolate dehydrogenase
MANSFALVTRDVISIAMLSSQAMSRPTYSAIVTHATRGRPALVFVPTRKHARLLALDLLTAAAADGEPSRFRLAAAAVSTSTVYSCMHFTLF